MELVERIEMGMAGAAEADLVARMLVSLAECGGLLGAYGLAQMGATPPAWDAVLDAVVEAGDLLDEAAHG